MALPVPMPSYSVPHISIWTWLIFVLLLGAALYIRRNKHLKVITKFIRNIWQALLLYRKRSNNLLAAFICAMGNTLFHTLAVWMSMKAFGIDLPLTVALITLTGGVAAATISPTPGGLVGSEAGLTATLMGFGVESGVALAVALSYRLVSYWIPLIPGVLALVIAKNRKLV
jgi:uncharacterized protein (TIRG00374 family)